jgi:hypothetical protein
MFNVEVFLSEFLLLLIHFYYIMIINRKFHAITYFPDFVKNTKTFQCAILLRCFFCLKLLIDHG